MISALPLMAMTAQRAPQMLQIQVEDGDEAGALGCVLQPQPRGVTRPGGGGAAGTFPSLVVNQSFLQHHRRMLPFYILTTNI